MDVCGVCGRGKKKDHAKTVKKRSTEKLQREKKITILPDFM